MLLKKIIRRIVAVIENSRDNLAGPTRYDSQIIQKNLYFQYRNSFQFNVTKPSFSQVGFRVFSQNEEDGILLFIFSLIGETNKITVEICCGDALECNTTNLIVHHKWWGLLFDGSQENINKATHFFKQQPDTKIWTPKLVSAWITKDNVNELIASNGIQGGVDLLSLDIDGIDYWLWDALTVINPRVIVLEYNHLWGPEKSVTVPYREDFVAQFSNYGSDYAGASLAAFVKLGKAKGYKLIGTNAYSTNAFFLRNDIEHSWLQEIDPKTCFDHPRAQFGMSVRWQNIKDKVWQNV